MNPRPSQSRLSQSFWLTQSFLALIVLFSVCLSTPAHSADAPAPVVSTSVLTTMQTSSGQPITLPRSDVELIVTTLEIQPGAKLPRHLHPYPRYGYVLQGALKITNEQTGTTEVFKPGDFIVEATGQWHYAETVGDTPAKLLVIDQVQGRRPGNTLAGK